MYNTRLPLKMVLFVVLLFVFCHASYGASYKEVGDMRMTEEKYNKVFKPSKTRYTSLALDDRWPGGKVTYAFESTIDDAGKDLIKKAIGEIEADTCLRFTERTTQPDYLSFFNGGDGQCWSYVGHSGSSQQVSLGKGCLSLTATVIHEIFHAMGFLHEQMRPDRDEHLTVLWDNIIPSYKSAYDIAGTDYQNEMSYGFGTVMHYPSYGFAVNSSVKTMEAKDPSNQPALDSYGMYTKCDAERVNVLYNCTSLITHDPACYKGGVVQQTTESVVVTTDGEVEGTTGDSDYTTEGYDYYWYWYWYYYPSK